MVQTAAAHVHAAPAHAVAQRPPVAGAGAEAAPAMLHAAADGDSLLAVQAAVAWGAARHLDAAAAAAAAAAAVVLGAAQGLHQTWLGAAS